MNLLERLKGFVQSNHLIPDERPVLLAVSGGMDSMLMARLFRDAGFAFAIAHCNFQLRGAESDADELFVWQIAETWGAPFFSTRFETKMYADTNGLSIQMAARELRYAWFRQIAGENGFSRIATAHHLNDSLETTLLNFTRGTGLSGLKGIAASTAFDAAPGTPEVTLIRPVLFATRSEIEKYAHQLQLAWRDDSSNANDDYARNFLRHHVIPLLEQLNPNFLHTAGRNLERLRETDDNLYFLLHNFFSEKTTPEAEQYIDKQKLAQMPAPRQALRELLKHLGFTGEQARQVAHNTDHIGLEIHSVSGWRLLNDREKILLVPPDTLRAQDVGQKTIYPDDLMVSMAGGGRMVLMQTDRVTDFPDGRAAIVIDAQRLRFPLILRPWKPGDSFQPFGMDGHSQKLQDFFTNAKLSRLEKEKALVLVNGNGEVIWVVGHRLDERFRTTSGTQKFLKISYT